MHIGQLGRHISLIMLGQYFLGDELSIGVEFAIGNDSLALTEQIGQDSSVAYGYLLFVRSSYGSFSRCISTFRRFSISRRFA